MAIGALVALLGGTLVPVMFLYYICIGVGYSAHTACLPAELANFFGPKYYSEIHGWLLPVVAILASFIPTLAGACYDSLGTYLPFFWVLVAIGVLGFIASLLVRIPKVKSPRMETSQEEEVINADANEVA